MSRIDPRARYAGQLALLAAAYFGAAKVGLGFAFENQSVSAVWPPTGLALGALLLWGNRMWPAVAVGAFLANITTAGPVLAVLAITAGNTLEAVVGAHLLRRVGFRPSLERVVDVASLVFYAAIVSTLISATVGVTSLWAAGLVSGDDVISTWRVWWFGDMGGDLIVAPALLTMASWPRFAARAWMRVEAVVLIVALVALTIVAFTNSQSFVYVVFPILLWVALRFGQPGTVVAGLIVSGIAISFTDRGDGPFIGGSADAELLRAQVFVGVAMITGLVTAALVTERREAEERLRHLADHDPLTGLLNRRRFTEELDRSIAYTDRYGGQGAVLAVDVDHFKGVNDAYGHAVGDNVITWLGDLLRGRVRKTDIVARLGGDELSVLLPRADQEEAASVAVGLLHHVREEAAPTSDGPPVPVTISIGVSQFGRGLDLNAQQVLAKADLAMYEAKDEGRDRVRVDRLTLT